MILPDDADDMVTAIVNLILSKHPELASKIVANHRDNLSKLVWDYHRQAVAYGPFKGLKLSDKAHWGGADKGAMVLGLYEQEVLHEISSLKGRYKTFIDLGAADGYYGIGVLVGELFERSYCFEITPSGQDVIRANAELNRLSDRVFVKGKADKDFHTQIAPDDLQSSVLFVDIEGGEFELFDQSVFSTFKNSVIFIELHDWMFIDASSKMNKIRHDSDSTHHWNQLTMGSRDLSTFTELHLLNDTDRWLLCSEGRPRQMSWVRLDPKEVF